MNSLSSVLMSDLASGSDFDMMLSKSILALRASSSLVRMIGVLRLFTYLSGKMRAPRFGDILKNYADCSSGFKSCIFSGDKHDKYQRGLMRSKLIARKRSRDATISAIHGSEASSVHLEKITDYFPTYKNISCHKYCKFYVSVGYLA